MEITNQIKKAAIASLTVGALVVAGLTTAGVASADDGMGIPDASNEVGVQQPHLPVRPPIRYVRPVQYPVYPVQYQVHYPVQYAYPTSYYVNYNFANYNYVGNIQASNLWISNTAEVINVPPAVVIAELNQNKTLMQIAAQRGWQRQFFLSALVSHAQADVAFAARNGTVNGVYANSLIASIPGQANYLIDRPGLR